MFGIKTKILKYLEFSHQEKNKKLSNDLRITELMNFFKADEFGHESNIKNADLGYGWIHYGLLRQIKAKKILCVGSRYGYVPAILAQACHDNGFGKVDFVDAGFGDEIEKKGKNSWTGKGFWRTKEGKNHFKNFGLENNIQLFVTTTQKFAKKYKSMGYDYIYIDGDHSYEGIKTDFKLFWPMLHEGGLMLLHDISIKETMPEGKYGVWKLWKEKAGENKIEISYLGSGLGIIQKKINR
ncbi:class I SAM-dependent methyltransferase [Patescibacteria group bacterium]|nr:class I SAM-dependent methyltransferase [Patescibacteria group bacterium]